MRTTHHTGDRLVFDPERTYSQAEEPTAKPRGFWLSIGDDWRQWCADNDYRPDGFNHVADFDIDTSDVLVLATVQAIRDFGEEYRVNTAPYGAIYARWGVDWTRVARRHSGIVIAPYQWTLRLDGVESWYYTWDCASACIWDLSAVRQAVQV